MTPLTIAFVPLTDSAILVAAKERGFAEQHGLDLRLIRDLSWATVRDRLVSGQVQAAHMLAPLAIAVTLGLSQERVALAAPFGLGLNGNALTLSPGLACLLDKDVAARIANPGEAARAFAKGIATAARRPVFGVVHRFSSHALMLRYWLGYAGVDPDRDVELRVLPPSLMVEALAAGEIDGFSAGEPWSSVAVSAGCGELAAIGANIWQRGVEKVLGLREDWAEANPDVLDRLLVALDEAGAWCDNSANHEALAELLARKEYVGQPAEIIAPSLRGLLRADADGTMVEARDFLMLHRESANFPWRSQALWIYSQMVRWNYLEADPAAEAAAAQVFRSDLYRRALAAGHTPLPGASMKVEGALDEPLPVGSGRAALTLGPDRFFDGRVFDPMRIADYLASFDANNHPK